MFLRFGQAGKRTTENSYLKVITADLCRNLCSPETVAQMPPPPGTGSCILLSPLCHVERRLTMTFFTTFFTYIFFILPVKY